jgi:hypothetical protein
VRVEYYPGAPLLIGVRVFLLLQVVHIPKHSDYSRRVRAQYWATAEEIYEMACRNLIEFETEGHDWANVAEEDIMIFCEETGEFIHPCHFELQCDS